MGLLDWFRRKKRAAAQPPPFPQPPSFAPQPPAQPPPPSVGGDWSNTAASPQPLPPGGFFHAGQVRPPAAPASQAHRAPIQRRESSDLDLGPFAPISEDDLRSAAGKLKNVWSNLWMFGRSNRIPPSSDPRTNLIDRAMVAQGLLTPEELAKIHQVGEAYDAARPDLQAELAKAEQVVSRTEEERAQRKAQKRAEAAERKRLHAEAVAQRRATDIIFLGRGVSSQLNDRGANAAQLESAGLPLLATPADVAAALGLSIPRLRWLAFHSDAATVSHYVRFQVRKRSGGVRQLAAPRERLAAAQQWILGNILQRIPTHPAAHGFVPGRNTVSNATPHVGQDVVVNADLRDFFPTITFPRVRGVFRQLGYSPATATVLGLICTESPRQKVIYAGRTFHVATGPRALPQGACTSPALSNLAARRLDSRLAGIGRKLAFNYTRYADDLTFSGSGEQAEKLVGYLLARIRHIADNEGFEVNEKKTRVLRPSTAQLVTGVVVNERPGIRRKTVRRLRAIIHRAKHEGLAAQNRENHPRFEAWVRGMIAYIGMVNPTQAEPLQAAFDSLPR
jgi:retron-type reverse transcriptase